MNDWCGGMGQVLLSGEWMVFCGVGSAGRPLKILSHVSVKFNNISEFIGNKWKISCSFIEFLLPI